MSQAILHTARLELRPLGPEHRDFIFQLDSNPEVMKHIGYGKPLDANDSAIVLKLLMETAAGDSGLGCWAGFHDDEFVGWWILAPAQSHDTPPQVIEGKAEIGFRIMPKFWRQGYAKEGVREMLRHGFQDLGVREVCGDTMAVNAGSRASMAACGMKLIRTFHNTYDNPTPGIEQGEVEYRITKDEWSMLQN